MAEEEASKKAEDEEELKPALREDGEEQLEVSEDEGPKRFVSIGPHVVQDTVTGLYWMKKDSWQDRGKYYNWHESREYADLKNIRKIGGFTDWRLPTMDEVATLYDPELSNTAKGGATIHIDPVFPEGSFKLHWTTSDTSTRRPRFDYTEGKIFQVDEYAFGAVRLVRKEPINRGDSRRARPNNPRR
ncbi:DUF1566 domain-containing protein [Nitrospina sp. 32_T5]|uniref:Lcl C-terminal domain-containing protein n=1 Tax=unclassified Nitrospina TaxID=2638683 RepID=UPI003F970BCE